MEEYMRECMRKLGLWHTRTFSPITTHDELEPIMATLGFVVLPAAAARPSTAAASSAATGWKEYVYLAKNVAAAPEQLPWPSPPRPRLPYPRIDGLHVYTYRAFIDAVNFYLEMGDNISDLFHIRGMPLNRVHDRNRKWRRMEEDESVFVYREGTLDQLTYNFYHFDKPGSCNGAGSCSGSGSVLVRDKGGNNQNNNDNNPIGCIVSLKDIV